MAFSHPGSCTRNPLFAHLRICKLHQMPQIFFGLQERCVDNRMRLQRAGCEQNFNDFYVLI